jgi:hypothetical protein
VAIWRKEHTLIKQWAESVQQSPLEGAPLVHMFHLTPLLHCGTEETWLIQQFYTQSAKKRDLKPFVKERLKLAGSRDFS